MQTSIFTADWKSFGLDDDDLQELEMLIMDRADSAPLIGGSGGARKIRFSPSSRRGGKSGAYRVIYGWFPDAAQVHLFLIYGKNEKAELNAEEQSFANN